MMSRTVLSRKSVARLSPPQRLAISGVLGWAVVLVAARELHEVNASAFARAVLAPMGLVVSLIPPHNIGTPENPIYEGTPLHLLAAIAAVPLCAALYTAAGYLLLTLVRRRVSATPTDADRSPLVSQEARGLPRRLKIAPFRRIAAVTLTVSAIGVIMGTVLGALVSWGISMIESPRWSVHPIALLVGALVGGMLGFVLAPVAAWTLMRHVPLWRAIGETALGTTVGAAAGLVLGPRLGDATLWPYALGIMGFAAAALRLRLIYPGAEGTASDADAPPGR